jgi:hypothetical protein
VSDGCKRRPRDGDVVGSVSANRMSSGGEKGFLVVECLRKREGVEDYIGVDPTTSLLHRLTSEDEEDQ